MSATGMDTAIGSVGNLEGGFVGEPTELDQAGETLMGGTRRSVSRQGSRGLASRVSGSAFFRRISGSKIGRSLSGRASSQSSRSSSVGEDSAYGSDSERMLPATGRRTASVSARIFGGRSKPTPLPTHIEDHSEDDDGLGEDVRSPEVSVSDQEGLLPGSVISRRSTGSNPPLTPMPREAGEQVFTFDGAPEADEPDDQRLLPGTVVSRRRPRSAPSRCRMPREAGEQVFTFDDSFEAEGSEAVPLMAQFDSLEDTQSASARSLYADLSGYEIDLLLNLLAEDPDIEAKLDRWMELIMSGDREGARRDVQEYINSHVGFRDTFSIAFHEGIQNWKARSGKERAIAAGKYTGNLVLSPVISAYEVTKGTGKFVVSKDYRDGKLASGKEFVTTGHVSYQTRKKFASACIKVGVAGVVGAAIAGEVGSAGMATPAIAAAAVGGVGVVAAVANGASRRKAPALVLGEIVGDSVESAARAAALAGLLGALGEVGAILSSEIAQTDEASVLGAVGRAGEEVVEGAGVAYANPELGHFDTAYSRAGDVRGMVETANEEGRVEGRWRS
ncbi:MAG: hypothetical protein S4CHLAM37_04480 [Chlamydiia bacterium]|nr:hypothetical protein [Chlamydiia bacterium]